MSSSTPRETSGALPEWSGIQKTDKNMIIDPILQQYRAVMRAALQEHMNLVTSQYMTGYARASRESGIGAAMPMDPPNLSDISDVNPVTTPATSWQLLGTHQGLQGHATEQRRMLP